MTDAQYADKYAQIVSLYDDGVIGIVEFNKRMEDLKRRYEESNKQKEEEKKKKSTPKTTSKSGGVRITRNRHTNQIEGDWRALDIETFTPIGGHIFPALTGGGALIEMLNRGITPEVAFVFAFSIVAAGLRFKSKQLSDANSTAGNWGLSNSEQWKIHGLTLAHLAAFSSLAYVASETLTKLVNGLETPENAGLIISGSCCAYQAVAVAIKKAKLNIRD